MNENNKTITELFVKRVQMHPQRTAVVDLDGSLTYQQLNQISDTISEKLTARRFGIGQVGVILMDRTNISVAAMLSILKAGGTYLFIEPKAPFLRNKEILQECSPGVILTTQSALEISKLGSEYLSLAHIFDVETMTASGLASQEKQVDIAPEAAYIIYTSGSTGKPKGAINYHSSVINLVQGLHDRIIHQYGDKINIAVAAPFVFDASVQQIFSSLLLGHTLFIVPEAVRLDGRELIRYFNQKQITLSDGTPTHLKLMQQAPESSGDKLGVRHFIIGGEALSVDVVKRFWNRFSNPKPEITNIYGVAECCVDATCYQIDLPEIESLGFVPIGKPLPNIKVVILDDQLNPVTKGASGEICIGHRAVGSGYLANKELTSQRFVIDPSDSTQILYRTGDQVRELPSNDLQFFGRFDRQIKLRGYRIEPGEIESAIRNYHLVYDHHNTLSSHVFQDSNIHSCTQCLLTDNHPGITIEDGVCSVCRQFVQYRTQINDYFQPEEEFHRLMNKARLEKKGSADCLLLYSGGKDSTFALFRLIEMGYNVATFTFDNEFISSAAIENIERITTRFGIDHVTASMDNMKTVFNESLRNTSTVCDGCFRALTLLSTKIAYEKGINVIITGLSRGQIIDTKLKRFLDAGIGIPGDIDEQLLLHRKIFYSREDTVSKTLTLPPIESIDNIQFIDFFRYSSIPSAEIRDYLAQTDKHWVAPKDTGFCSTNCMINDVGIYVHKVEKGYHNYAAPLSWDCRLGVKSIDNARNQLKSQIDEQGIHKILKSFGYNPKIRALSPIQDAVVTLHTNCRYESFLTAYFVASSEVNIADLRSYLSKRLPSYMIPQYLMRIETLPVNRSGKIDIEKLPIPEAISQPTTTITNNNLINTLTALWEEVLGVARINIDDNFFDLGGESLKATILISRLEKEFDMEISVIDAIKNPTIREMSKFLEKFRRQVKITGVHSPVSALN